MMHLLKVWKLAVREHVYWCIADSRRSDMDSVLERLPSFKISDPPTSDSNAALLQDFVEQSRSSDNGLTPSSNVVRYLDHQDDTGALPQSGRYFFHRKSTHNIGQLLDTLMSKSAALTVAFMPSSNASNLNSWGTYTLPSESSMDSVHARAHVHLKRQGSEMLEAEAEDFGSNKGEEIATAKASSSSSSSSSESASSTSDSSSKPTSTTPPAGILPVCFASVSACNAMTNSCSGHGSCELKYKNKDQEGDDVECFACKCKPQIDKNDMGEVTTTRWGGPACQKKDVSTSFWLLAGFTVAMVSAVAWGIGMLMSMGSEELPSVIGAGVSGPGARGK
jgi:hypothetical protein